MKKVGGKILAKILALIKKTKKWTLEIIPIKMKIIPPPMIKILIKVHLATISRK